MKRKEECNWRCAASGGQYNWKASNRILVIQASTMMQDGTDRSEAKVFRAHAPPHGVCDNLVRRQKMMQELQRFTTLDKHEAVKSVGLGKDS